MEDAGRGARRMQQIFGWLERPQKKLGLDNLGAQHACVTIYTRLLPGVTNVTDRAAYFGFYPWFVHAFEQRHPTASEGAFRQKLRLADCLMTLVAERHAIKLGQDIGRHSATCPGRLTLGPVAHGISQGDRVGLARYADRSDANMQRYFKNPLGGLGQYYLGSLRDEYTVLRTDPRGGVGYWLETCVPLAEAYGAGLDEDLFFSALDAEAIGAGELDDLASFCPCGVLAPDRTTARDALINMILRGSSPTGVARSASFGLLLDYLHHRSGEETDDAVKEFLASCYTATLPIDSSSTGDRQAVASRGWALYTRNEMLSLAWSTIFKNALDALDGEPKPFPTVDDLANWLISTPAFAAWPSTDFGAMVRHDLETAPSLGDASHPEHELSMWRGLLAVTPPPVGTALRLLVRLTSRAADEKGDAYRELDLQPGALSGYPLTLNGLRTSADGLWATLSGEAWLRTLVSEALVTHQRIAVRKMGQSGEDTLMFRAGDLGFFVHRPMERIVETQPRLRQALQILRDLGLTTWEARRHPELTDLGHSLRLELAR